MKYIIILLTCLTLLGCGGYTYNTNIQLTTEQALEQKANCEASGTFVNDGVNYMYRYGFYIYALHMHGILEQIDIDRFVDELDKLIFPNGYYSHYFAGWDRIMSRDDYLGALLGLYVAVRYYNHSRALDHLTFMYERMTDVAAPEVAYKFKDDFTDFIIDIYQEYVLQGLTLGRDVWNFYHQNVFIRSVGRTTFGMWFWDAIGYFAGAKKICSKSEEVTSDKILWTVFAIINRENDPNYWTGKADQYCHDRVDFDDALRRYYGGYCLGKLLEGTL